jgi:hypothetical protein
MGNFYSDVICKSPQFSSVAAVRDISMLEPVTREAVINIMADASAMGIKLMITETYRSQQRQRMLFDQKATQLETVGVHHYGLAADFCKVVDGNASWAGDWSFLRDLANKHGLISGLDWGLPNAHHSFVDPDHVQRCTVEQQNALFTQNWYPSSGDIWV